MLSKSMMLAGAFLSLFLFAQISGAAKPGDEVSALKKTIADQAGAIAQLKRAVDQRDAQIASLQKDLAAALAAGTRPGPVAADAPPSAGPGQPAAALPFGGRVQISADGFFSALGIKDYTVIRVDNERDNAIAFNPQIRIVCRDGSSHAATIEQASPNYAAIDPRSTDEKTAEARQLRQDMKSDFVDHQWDCKGPQDQRVPAHSVFFFKICYEDVVGAHPQKVAFTGDTLDGCWLSYPGPHSGSDALLLSAPAASPDH